MSGAEVEATILEILRDELEAEVESRELDLIAAGIIDSLALVDLLFQLEQRFGVTVTLDDLDPANFASVERMTAFVLRRKTGMPS